jgi:hypothetical protein
MGLSRFFDFPIIQAPKRNSKLNKEMWTKATFWPGSLGTSFVRAPCHAAPREAMV